jgi:hypothetical protein
MALHSVPTGDCEMKPSRSSANDSGDDTKHKAHPVRTALESPPAVPPWNSCARSRAVPQVELNREYSCDRGVIPRHHTRCSDNAGGSAVPSASSWQSVRELYLDWLAYVLDEWLISTPSSNHTPGCPLKSSEETRKVSNVAFV